MISSTDLRQREGFVRRRPDVRARTLAPDIRGCYVAKLHPPPSGQGDEFPNSATTDQPTESTAIRCRGRLFDPLPGVVRTVPPRLKRSTVPALALRRRGDAVEPHP